MSLPFIPLFRDEIAPPPLQPPESELRPGAPPQKAALLPPVKSTLPRKVEGIKIMSIILSAVVIL